MMVLRALLDRLFPHDTLMIGGQPYMHRWYVFGYAPSSDDPNEVDRTFHCATCKAPVVSGAFVPWVHAETSVEQAADHVAEGVSDPRTGWRWRDHGLGAIRIHCIVASDDSRAYHDHPWPFAAIGLAGSYMEERPFIAANGQVPLPGRPDAWRRRFRAPFINVKRATDLHVLAVDNGPVWTLFLTRPKQRSWGFAGPFGWLGWREFDATYPERNAWTDAGRG